MYAERYSAGPTFRPGSLGLALAGTVLPIAAMVLGLQIRHVLVKDPPIPIIDIRPDPLPPPDPPPQPRTRVEHQNPEVVFTPPVPLPPIPTDPLVKTTTQPPLTPPPPLPPTPGAGDLGTVMPVRPPVIVGAEVDPRYAALLQPPYPAEETRAGREGRVVLRVLVGADGRVRQVEKVSAASDAFFAAAQKQALTRWRFRPATRDGVAIEQWKTMAIRFQLEQE